MSDRNSYRRIITEVKYKIMSIEVGKEKMVKESWDNLRKGMGK